MVLEKNNPVKFVYNRPLKKLPDIRSMKCQLKKILIDDENNTNHKILFNAVMRVHKLYIHLCMFIRLYILNKYHKNEEIPYISKDFISMPIKVLLKSCTVGPKPKGSNLLLFDELSEFYESEYQQLGYVDKIDGTNLSNFILY